MDRQSVKKGYFRVLFRQLALDYRLGNSLRATLRLLTPARGGGPVHSKSVCGSLESLKLLSPLVGRLIELNLGFISWILLSPQVGPPDMMSTSEGRGIMEKRT